MISTLSAGPYALRQGLLQLELCSPVTSRFKKGSFVPSHHSSCGKTWLKLGEQNNFSSKTHHTPVQENGLRSTNSFMPSPKAVSLCIGKIYWPLRALLNCMSITSSSPKHCCSPQMSWKVHAPLPWAPKSLLALNFLTWNPHPPSAWPGLVGAAVSGTSHECHNNLSLFLGKMCWERHIPPGAISALGSSPFTGSLALAAP